jgi:N-acetylglucosaminyl-diphospho-decaprenol L-rhamnosyltransferase
MPTLSVLIVTHNSRDAISRTLPPLTAQLRDGDELVVVDNDSDDGTVAAARELAPSASVIETGSNLGFSAGCNRGAEAATGELLCLLNPDAVPQAGWRDAIELPATDGRGWSAWQALVTADGGRQINTRGGILHFTGIGWAGGAGTAMDDLPATESLAIEEPGFVSGACLVIARELYAELGAMPERFFLYHEDVDLSLRVRLAGGELGVEPAARVDHDYDFDKGAAKWRYLERNRWATLIRTYPGGLLFLLLPALLATELALVPVSIAGGWFFQKLRAWGETLIWLPRLIGERRKLRSQRTISAGQFAAGLTASLDSPFLGRAGRSRALAAVLGGYWRLVRRLVGAG